MENYYVTKREVTEVINKLNISESIYRKYIKHLNSIGLSSNKMPNFKKIAIIYKNQQSNEIDQLINIIFKTKTGILEVSQNNLATQKYKPEDMILFSINTNQYNTINFELNLLRAPSVPELILKYDIQPSIEGSTFRKTIFGLQDVDSSDYDLEEEDEFSENPFDTLLPAEETLQIQFNSYIYFDIMDFDGQIETVLLKTRIDK